MIKIWTDDSSDHHNPRRPGGWAYVLKIQKDDYFWDYEEKYGGSLGTTNNQMELNAILEAIKRVNKIATPSHEVTIFSDSEWAVKCLTKEYNCRARVVRQYLDEIEWAIGNRSITFIHIAGHSGIQENERCDVLAVAARLEVTA